MAKMPPKNEELALIATIVAYHAMVSGGTALSHGDVIDRAVERGKVLAAALMKEFPNAQ